MLFLKTKRKSNVPNLKTLTLSRVGPEPPWSTKSSRTMSGGYIFASSLFIWSSQNATSFSVIRLDHGEAVSFVGWGTQTRKLCKWSADYWWISENCSLVDFVGGMGWHSQKVHKLWVSTTVQVVIYNISILFRTIIFYHLNMLLTMNVQHWQVIIDTSLGCYL